MARKLLFALAALSASACSVDLKVPEGAQISCASDADCPEGYVCRTTVNQCFRAGGDAVAPELVAGSLAVAPDRVGTNTASLIISFRVNEPLATAPVADLTWAAGGTTRALAVSSVDNATNAWALTYTPAPGADPEGVVGFVVTLTDAAGNRSRVVDDNVAILDFTPPALAEDLGGGAIVSLTLTPPATSPLRDVTALAAGTRLRVDFAASEPLAGDAASPVVTLASGGVQVNLSQVSGNGLSYVYETLVDGSLPQGTAALTARITDLAGNAATVDLGTVDVITKPPDPPAVDVADSVVFTRLPWGADATSGNEAYFLEGLAGAVPADAVVIAYSAETVIDDKGQLVGREIGRTPATANGAFGVDGTFQLFMGDSPDLYVAAVDPAGNVSDADGDPRNGVQAALVRDVAWIATLQGKIPGRVFPNPHAFEGREVWTATLAQYGARPLSTPADVGRQDGVRASVRGAPYWLPARRPSLLVHRSGTGMSYDPVRGCRVAYGGQGWDGCDSGFYCDQWESCRGAPWSRPVPEDPEGDGNPALANRLPLLFAGGRGATVLASGTDLWEWDGTSWRRLVMSDPEGDGNPAARTNHAVAYDEARQRLLLFGGQAAAGGAALGDLWETDFRSWRQLCTAAPCTSTRPAARFSHAMVYDPVRKNVLLVGGQLASGFDAASWTWNGAAWTQRCSTGACATAAQRREHGLAFDTPRGRAVLFGGTNGGGYTSGTFEWDGSTWTAVCTAAPCSTTLPDPRGSPSLFYDAERVRVVLSGGEVGFGGGGECGAGPFCDSEWEWSGSAWTEVVPSSTFPPSVRGVRPVYDPVRDRVLLFGGQDNSGAYTQATWLWDGARWTNAAVAAPSVRSQYAAAWVSTGAGTGEVALFGGLTTGFVLTTSTAYRWNGTNWFTNGTGPTARYAASLAQSTRVSPPGGALVFGGHDTSSNEFCDLSEVSSQAWSTLSNCLASGPEARFGMAMVRATGFPGSPVVMFGGAGLTEYNDVWNWNGSSWTEVSPGGAQSASQPRTRIGHTLLFDTARSRVLMLGGAPAAAVANINCVDDYGGLPCHDFWEWSGSAWTRVFPVDLFRDGNPDESRLAGVAFDTARRRGVGIESPSGTGATVNTWWWSGGGDERPGQVASILFDAAEVRRPFDVLDLDVAWVGGATGSPGGTVTNGATLQVWDNQGWRSLVQSTTARPGATEALRWTLSGDAALGSTPVAERQRFMVGDGRTLHLALVPRAASGSAAGFGEVTTDYLEVMVRYRLAAP